MWFDHELGWEEAKLKRYIASFCYIIACDASLTIKIT